MPYKIWKENNTLFAEYKVRNYHVDSYGHVNNAAYLLFLEDARTDFFSYFGYPLSYLADKDIFVFITEIKVKYLKPLHLDNVITVTGNISSLRKVRATWHQEIWKESKRVAVAEVYGAFLNSDSKIIRIPDFLEKSLKTILAD